MLLPEPLEFVGEWEFPGDESERLPGTLKVDTNGKGVLSLFGNKLPPTPNTGRISAGTYDIVAFLNGRHVDTLHGMCGIDRPITLLGARVRPTQIGSQVNTCEADASVTVIGKRVNHYDEPWIRSVRIDIEGLDACVAWPRIMCTPSENERHHIFNYSVPDDIVLVHRDAYCVKLCFSLTIASPSRTRRRLLLKTETRLRIEFVDKGSLKDVFEIMSATQRFLRFTFSEADIAVRSVTAHDDRERSWIDVYWPRFSRLTTSTDGDDRFSQPALLLDEDASAYAAWLELHESSYVQLDAYFAAIGHGSDSLVQQIFVCATGLESLYKNHASVPHVKIDKVVFADWLKKLQKAASSIDDPLSWKWFWAEVKNANRVSFADMLRYWIDTYGDEAGLTRTDIDPFKKSRNAIAHQGQVDTQREDVILVSRFACLFSIILFDRLGVSRAKRDAIVARGEWLCRLKFPTVL